MEFEEVIGKKETYYVSKLNYAGYKLELYIYGDEAGFGVDGTKEWLICEVPDYDSEGELIEAFVASIDKKLRILKAQEKT